VLPVNLANNLATRIKGSRHNDVVMLKVWMADAEVTESGIPRDE